MQHEELYNLHKTAFLTTALFVCKSGQTGSSQILTLLKRHFWHMMSSFFTISSFDLSSVLEIKSATVSKAVLWKL
jgi:hypothetical protein